MRGRDVFIQSLILHGVRHIFGNPGTTESPLLDALGNVPSDAPSIDYVVHLHEGVAVGAASYYARASGRTGVVNLHAAPGLGNGIGMLYNALKAKAPIVITAGQQDTRMLRRDPILAHDLVAMAAPVCKWSAQVQTADEMDEVMRRAFKIANDPPYGPVFVALPIDVMEQETQNGAQAPGRLHRAPAPDASAVQEMIALMLAAHAPVIVVGDEVARAGAVDALVRLAEQIGAPVWFEGIRGHASFPGTHAHARSTLPFDAAGIRKTLAGADLVLLIGGAFFEEIWFSPGSPFPEGAKVLQIESSPQALGHNFAVDAGLVAGMVPSLRAINDALGGAPGGTLDSAGAAQKAWRDAARSRCARLADEKARDTEAYQARLAKAWARMPISMPRAMAELRRATPANAVIVEESITASIDLAAAFPYETAEQFLGARGGGIGQGLAGAIGAALAHSGAAHAQGEPPERPVLCVSGDGSAMYSIQALWTAAHHQLPIVFVILANREYRVLKHNLDLYRQRFNAPSSKPYPHMDLATPALGFVELAAGMGVPAVRVSEPDHIAAAIEQAFAARAPRLVEIVIEGKR